MLRKGKYRKISDFNKNQAKVLDKMVKMLQSILALQK